jgi:hypothetical protein
MAHSHHPESPEVSSKSGPGSSPDTPTRNLGGGMTQMGMMEMSSSPYGFGGGPGGGGTPYGAFRPVIPHPHQSSHQPNPYQHPAFASYYLHPQFMGNKTKL